MKRFGFIILFVLSFAPFCQSQGSFQNGFIITSNSDTVFGQLENRPNMLNYRSCSFMKDNEVKEYTASQIKGFGYKNGKCFRSEIVEGEFVEILVSGFLQLYKSQSVYYLKKGLDVPIKLESITKENTLSEGIHEFYFVRDTKWKGLLSYAIYDCFPNSPKLVEKVNFYDEDLAKIVIRYNQRKNNDFVEFNNSKPWTKFEFGAAAGLENSILHKTDIQNRFPYLKSEYTSLNPTIGLLFGISSPRFSDRFSFQPEIFLTKVNYDGLIHTTQFTAFIYETHMEWTSLTIPATIKYSYTFGKFKCYLQAGIVADLQLQAKTSYIRKEVVGGVVITDPETEAFTLEGWAYGFCGGLGLQREFNYFQVGIAFRYNQITDVARDRLFEINPERFSLSLQIFTK